MNCGRLVWVEHTSTARLMVERDGGACVRGSVEHTSTVTLMVARDGLFF